MALLNSRVVRISFASLATGLLIGGVGTAFRLLLIKADGLRNELVLSAHAWHYAGWLVPVSVGMVGAALARWLVVGFAPTAGGSGRCRWARLYLAGGTPPEVQKRKSGHGQRPA